MRIVQLDSSYKGMKLPFRYETRWHYRAEPSESAECFGVSFRKESFETSIGKEFDGTLLEDWLERPYLFGAEEGGRNIGYIELDHETWNNRMRVTNLWVEEGARRRGVGRALIFQAMETARKSGARGLVLETQSCNYPAISFYRTMGFRFTGCDLTAYRDDDVARGEVRVELAILFCDRQRVELPS